MLEDSEEQWIESQIASGRYLDASEYIRDLIRRDQAKSSGLDRLRALLVEAEKSGEPQPFDRRLFEQKMRSKYLK